MKNLKFLLISITLSLMLFSAVSIAAQTTSVFTTGLNSPNRIITAGQNSLLVAESGTFTPNQGRVSMVNRETGARQTLVDGLPSGISRSGGVAPSGPSALKFKDLKLYLTIGQGDAVVPRRLSGETFNLRPSSPLFDSVLELTLPADYEQLTGNFTLAFADQTALAGGSQITLMNAQGKMMGMRVLANLPDWRYEGRPTIIQPTVRPSNLYGIEMALGNLYVVDASFNQLYKINLATGAFETFVVFPPRPNPLPFGPPVSEAVPDGIRLFGGKLLVSFLVGFPFAPNTADVRSVDLQTGQHQVFIGNLTSAIDVLPIGVPGDNDLFYTLEFTTNFLANPLPPGRLRLYTSPTATPIALASNLITPTSIARDADSGDLFITENFTGRIIRVAASETALTETTEENLEQ